MGTSTLVQTRPRLRRSRVDVVPRVDLAELGHAVVRHQPPAWLRRYRRATFAVDVAASVLAAVLAAGLSHLAASEPRPALGALTASGTLAALPLVWVLVMSVSGGYAAPSLGIGARDWRCVMRSGIALLAILGVLTYLAGHELPRSQVLIGFPVLVTATVAGRGWLRRILRSARREDRMLRPTVLVGAVESVSRMAREFRRDPAATGLAVVGACVSGVPAGAASMIDGVPLLGDVDDCLTAAVRAGADVVAVAGDAGFGDTDLTRLGWSLEQIDVELVVSPGVVGVSDSRLSVCSAGALSLLHVSRPAVSRLKMVLDPLLAAVLVVLFSPVLLTVAALIRLDDRGPVFFRQDRIGSGGISFPMIKFRTMCVNAEARLSELTDDGNGVLFKMKADPRVTRIGRFLRKYSIDELPQLFNVVLGQMSLVGPRPPLGREVDTYGSSEVVRRLRVRPGMTGLWQVSGRSDLSWEDSVRLDLWYVDNWSPGLDLRILARTVRAVFNGSGAY